jgi:hypothetical protein
MAALLGILWTFVGAITLCEGPAPESVPQEAASSAINIAFVFPSVLVIAIAGITVVRPWHWLGNGYVYTGNVAIGALTLLAAWTRGLPLAVAGAVFAITFVSAAWYIITRNPQHTRVAGTSKSLAKRR